MKDVIIFSNTRGFQKDKKIQINNFVRKHRPVVFLVAEHFQSCTQHLELDGYELAGCYCRNSRERGGVAVFVRLDEKYLTKRDLDIFNVKKEFEVRSVEIPSRDMVVTVLYRPPSGSLRKFYSNLENLLKIYRQSSHQKHVLAGDFNIDNGASNKTEEILAAHSFNFTCTAKTHDHGRCLDNFVVDFVPSTTRVMMEKLSDHHCIQLTVPSGTDKKMLGAARKLQPIQVSGECGSGENNRRNPFAPRLTTVSSPCPSFVPQANENQVPATASYQSLHSKRANSNFQIETLPDLAYPNLSELMKVDTPIGHSILYSKSTKNHLSTQVSSSSNKTNQFPSSSLNHFEQEQSRDCKSFSKSMDKPTGSLVKDLYESLDKANELIHNLKQKVFFLDAKVYYLQRRYEEKEK